MCSDYYLSGQRDEDEMIALRKPTITTGNSCSGNHAIQLQLANKNGDDATL